MSKLLDWLAGGAISSIGNIILQYKTKVLEAESEDKRIALTKDLSLLEAQQAVMIAESKQVINAVVKSLLAAPAIFYWWKLIVWDTVLGLGVTPYPGDHVVWFVTLIPPAYFLSFWGEKLNGRR